MTGLLVGTWPFALVFWGVFLWAFVPEFFVVSGRREPASTPLDANSKRAIMIGQPVAVLSAFWIAANVPSGALPGRAWWFAAGIAAIVCGRLLRRHCFRMLGASFTGSVIVSPEQLVIERGAYRNVRHPSYTAGMILFLGIGLALANAISVAVLLAIVAMTYVYRVRVEERALAAVIGDPYRQYMRRTRRFIPFVV
ncbi:MAG TPA: isoprenylcysteine carboxylmethyltransferase family protein [Vicinamibacterales bacterium]|nr:isoprenylcysteine carboxylmethyltransferase family protein [Vicinamibacterales bacterium]